MYKTVIGLEIHSELKTLSKMFCSCANDSKEKTPNANVCPTCLGHPGTLPVANKEAIRKVIKTGLALNCNIPNETKFDRKNYFYPDLPKGYQISQYDKPLCEKGFLEIKDKKIRITRIHLEEDTGKLIHPLGKNYSLIDFNRAGVPLMELVTEPDIEFPEEARKFAEEFQLILRYLDVSSADMECGEMRVEVNISLMKDNKMGTKVEIKNLNSFKAVEGSIKYEIERQKELLEKGEKIIQETRGWDEKKGITISQRKKEEAHDYRYFPEPDIPTINISQKIIEEIKSEIPELPFQKLKRFKEEYFLEEETANIFVVNRSLSNYFERVISELKNWIKEIDIKSKITKEESKKLIKLASNYIISDLQGILNGKSTQDRDFLITSENFAEFIALIYKGEISSKIAKSILLEMFKTGADPSHIIEEKGLKQIKNEDEIEIAVKNVINENKKAVEDYKKGKKETIQFLAGKVMALTKGRANPEIVLRLLKEDLSK